MKGRSGGINRRRLLAAGVTALAAGGSVFQTLDAIAGESDMAHLKRAALQLPVNGEFPSLAGAVGWLNSPPLTPAGLRGKVVLVEFWTYTCINWLRVQPYVRAWSEKYKDKGLVVIGAHTPEFPFEKEEQNVRWAVNALRVGYPVAIDTDYAVWRAFDNHYWPALYFIDARGQIRHHQFGEGDYDQSEAVIQQLLEEAGMSGVDSGFVSPDEPGLEAAADWSNLRSPENYLGYGRSENFASPGGVSPDEPHDYALPTRMRANDWALSGEWRAGQGAVALTKAGGRIAYRFHARDVHLVMGPPSGAAPVRFQVSIDGEPPGDSHGSDADEAGNGTADRQRLYQLIRQSGQVTDRQFEIEFLDPGLEAFAFTFG